MKKLWMAALLSWAVTAGAATGSHGGPAATHFISYGPSGVVFVWFDVGAVIGPAACVPAANIGNMYAYAFDATTPGGKTMLAGVIAAHSTGVNLWFAGTGACDAAAGFETLGNFHTAD